MLGPFFDVLRFYGIRFDQGNLRSWKSFFHLARLANGFAFFFVFVFNFFVGWIWTF